MKWECNVCGRSYNDAEPSEVRRWQERLRETGYCCDLCEEDNKPETVEAKPGRTIWFRLNLQIHHKDTRPEVDHRSSGGVGSYAELLEHDILDYAQRLAKEMTCEPGESWEVRKA